MNRCNDRYNFIQSEKPETDFSATPSPDENHLELLKLRKISFETRSPQRHETNFNDSIDYNKTNVTFHFLVWAAIIRLS